MEKLNYMKQDIENIIKKLIEYTEHSRDCILSQFEAGEPTEDGGYRQKFDGKWYQSKPIDETPKCNCGLDNTCPLIADEVLKVVVENYKLEFEKLNFLTFGLNNKLYIQKNKVLQLLNNLK